MVYFLTGGVRSGKSSYALSLAKELSAKVVFIATAEALDSEMNTRIKTHKKKRPKNWGVVEEPLDIGTVILKVHKKYNVAIIDCVGMWVSNLMHKKMSDKGIEGEITKFVGTFSKSKMDLIIVSNEVGSGIVPGNQMARRFRDLVGLANQLIAQKADKVFFMVSGIPWGIK